MKGVKQADVLMEEEISGGTGACIGRIIDVSKRDGKRRGDCEKQNVYRG